MQKIIIGSDHGGYALKEYVKMLLLKQGFFVEDVGTHSEDSCDYPDYAHKVSEEIVRGNFDKGILICKSGIGMSMAANKTEGIRAALCYNHEASVLCRAHNNANVLVLGSRFVTQEEAEKIVQAFLITEFEGGRHAGRVDKIERVSL